MLQAMNKSFPKLLPQEFSKNPSSFDGYITIRNQDYFISIDTPFFPHVQDIILKKDIELSMLFHNSGFDKLKFLSSDSVLHYLQTLQKTCEQYVKEHEAYEPVDGQFVHVKSLLSHIEDLGWEKVSHVSSDFSVIELIQRDGRGRVHSLKVEFSALNPTEAAVIEGDLPSQMNSSHFSKGETLCSIYEDWNRRLEALQPFWNVMDDLDETALVIDPAQPQRKHTIRRILLENRLCVRLEVCPEQPLLPPKCHLLGPPSLVALFNEKLVQLYQVWDESESIVYNLEHILNVSVLRKSCNSGSKRKADDAVLDDWDVECAVCYSLHYEEELPDIACDHCRKNFHPSCLYDWLQSLPGSHQCGQFVKGECPYCTKAISCNFPGAKRI